MSGGTVSVVRTASVGMDPVASFVRTAASNTSVSGGEVVFGGGAAQSGTIYRASGPVPSLTIHPTMTLLIYLGPLYVYGATIVNNGSITNANDFQTPFVFASASPMTYSGSGTFGTLATPNPFG